MHKKGITEEAAKKRTRRTVKVQRAIVGASLEVIRARRNQTDEIRKAARIESVQASKDAKEKKKAEKVKATAATRGSAKPKVSKQQQKGAAPKVQAKSR
jgi:large subunit ribosomal protein L24e